MPGINPLTGKHDIFYTPPGSIPPVKHSELSLPGKILHVIASLFGLAIFVIVIGVAIAVATGNL